MMKRFDPDWVKMEAAKLTNAANMPLVSLDPTVEQLQILPDSTVQIPHFKPDRLIPNRFYAHPNTIRAVRKELFLIAQITDDLALEYPCDACKKLLDWQFWQHCPYCECHMPQEFKNPKFSIR